MNRAEGERPGRRWRAGILGATGIVGQRLVCLLADHPWFEVTGVAASERSEGKRYAEAVPWRLEAPIPGRVRDLEVRDLSPNLDCDFVFSALDSSVAGPAEEAFARAGYPVISNCRNHRMDEDVPLLIPEVNAFGIAEVFVVTLQAISGAGYPGVASLDIADNVIPFIAGEEEKLQSEPLKILGTVEGNRFSPASVRISAQCNRVPVLDGHLECVSLRLQRKASPAEVAGALRNFRVAPQLETLPSALRHPIVVREECARPQPRLDRDAGNGMAVVAGHVRACPLFDVKFTLLSHNLIRGAAGAALLNAELLASGGYFD